MNFSWFSRNSRRKKILKMKKRRRKLIARALKSASKGIIEDLKLIGKDEVLREICDGKGNTLLHRYVQLERILRFRKEKKRFDPQTELAKVEILRWSNS